MSKRDDILEAAQCCFYDCGITATGVDTIAEAAGVSKRTLYNHFPAKEDLILACIVQSDRRWRDWLTDQFAAVDDPVERLLVFVESYFRPDRDEFRGCLLINSAADGGDDDQRVLATIQDLKRQAHAHLEELVRNAGLDHPEETARTIALLLEGGVALYGVYRDRRGVDDVRRAVLDLIERATPDPVASAAG